MYIDNIEHVQIQYTTAASAVALVLRSVHYAASRRADYWVCNTVHCFALRITMEKWLKYRTLKPKLQDIKLVGSTPIASGERAEQTASDEVELVNEPYTDTSVTHTLVRNTSGTDK